MKGFLLLHMQTAHVTGGAAGTPRTTPTPSGLGTPPKGNGDEKCPGLDSLEAGSGDDRSTTIETYSFANID